MSLMAAGTIFQIAGSISANQAQARAEKQTAKFFDEQALFARDAMFRELQIAERQYAFRFGQQVSAIAGGGADVSSGSATNILAGTLASQVEELLAIRKKGELDVKLARLRAKGAAQTAETLGSASYNLLQASSRVMTNVAMSSDSWDKPTAAAPSMINLEGDPDSSGLNRVLTIRRTA